MFSWVILVVCPWLDQMTVCYTHTHTHTLFLPMQISWSSMPYPTEAQKTWMENHVTTGIPFAESDMGELPPWQYTTFYKAITTDHYAYCFLFKSLRFIAVIFLKTCFHKDSSVLLNLDPKYKKRYNLCQCWKSSKFHLSFRNQMHK